jgi:hyperosmotically inducible protein
MMTKNSLILMTSAVLLAASIGACDGEGPAERAGEKIDEAVETTAERMDAARESAAESVERVGDEVESATDR